MTKIPDDSLQFSRNLSLKLTPESTNRFLAGKKIKHFELLCIPHRDRSMHTVTHIHTLLTQSCVHHGLGLEIKEGWDKEEPASAPYLSSSPAGHPVMVGMQHKSNWQRHRKTRRREIKRWGFSHGAFRVNKIAGIAWSRDYLPSSRQGADVYWWTQRRQEQYTHRSDEEQWAHMCVCVCVCWLREVGIVRKREGQVCELVSYFQNKGVTWEQRPSKLTARTTMRRKDLISGI